MQPVSLLLLDINMPILNGLQVLLKVKEKFELTEKKLAEIESTEDQPASTSKLRVVRPLIAYLSQNDYGQMKMFCQPDEQADVFLAKPL